MVEAAGIERGPHPSKSRNESHQVLFPRRPNGRMSCLSFGEGASNDPRRAWSRPCEEVQHEHCSTQDVERSDCFSAFCSSCSRGHGSADATAADRSDLRHQRSNARNDLSRHAMRIPGSENNLCRCLQCKDSAHVHGKRGGPQCTESDRFRSRGPKRLDFCGTCFLSRLSFQPLRRRLWHGARHWLDLVFAGR